MSNPSLGRRFRIVDDENPGAQLGEVSFVVEVVEVTQPGNMHVYDVAQVLNDLVDASGFAMAIEEL